MFEELHADFTPYGQEMQHTERLYPGLSCPPNYRFTGYEYDSETGLSYAFARYYSPRLGRFLSTDPLGGFIGDLQSHNAYAYVVNNPLNFHDALGMWCSAAVLDRDTPCNSGNFNGGGQGGFFPSWSLFDFIETDWWNPEPTSYFVKGAWQVFLLSFGGAGASQKLFLRAYSDCGQGGDRKITYDLMQSVNGVVSPAMNYTVKENVVVFSGSLYKDNEPEAPDPNGFSHYSDYISGTGTRDTTQTFTAYQAGQSPQTVAFMRDVYGQDYGTNAIYVQGANGSTPAKIFVNGHPTPPGTDCVYHK